MTTIINQLTCSLCNIKIDELKWDEHLISLEHLQKCKEVKDGIVSKFSIYFLRHIITEKTYTI